MYRCAIPEIYPPAGHKARAKKVSVGGREAALEGRVEGGKAVIRVGAGRILCRSRGEVSECLGR